MDTELLALELTRPAPPTRHIRTVETARAGWTPRRLTDRLRRRFLSRRVSRR